MTVLIEGEEEVGSFNLEPFLGEHRAALAADIAIISDTGMWDIDTPAITTSLRGMVYVELTLHAAEAGFAFRAVRRQSALNPINALTRILGALHDDTRAGSSSPGFYDGVAETAPAQLAEWAALGFDEAAFLGGIGLSVPVGRARPGGRWSGCGRGPRPTSTASGAAIPGRAARR